MAGFSAEPTVQPAVNSATSKYAVGQCVQPPHSKALKMRFVFHSLCFGSHGKPKSFANLSSSNQLLLRIKSVLENAENLENLRIFNV